MEIMPNWTVVFLQLIPFAVTAAVLYKIILMPMLDYLEERQAAIASGTTGVDAINADLEARTAEYDRQLQIARSKGSEIRNAKRVEAKRRRNAPPLAPMRCRAAIRCSLRSMGRGNSNRQRLRSMTSATAVR